MSMRETLKRTQSGRRSSQRLSSALFTPVSSSIHDWETYLFETLIGDMDICKHLSVSYHIDGWCHLLGNEKQFVDCFGPKITRDGEYSSIIIDNSSEYISMYWQILDHWRKDVSHRSRSWITSRRGRRCRCHLYIQRSIGRVSSLHFIFSTTQITIEHVVNRSSHFHMQQRSYQCRLSRRR